MIPLLVPIGLGLIGGYLSEDSKNAVYADGGDILDMDTISRIETNDFADVAMYQGGGEIANTILKQLGGAGKLHAMTGAYQFVDLKNGLSFRIKNQRANYIKIMLNGKDLYDVEVGRIRGADYKVVKSANDLYFDQLKPFIESATGMYLSLF